MDYLRDLLSTHYILVVIITLLVGRYLFWRWQFYSGTPPGPWGLPIVGYLPFLSDRPHLDVSRLAKRYGDVFSLQVGSRYVVLLNSYEAIKEGFVKQGEVLTGKPSDTMEAAFGDRKSLFVTDGEIWREQHRFLLSTLRDFGFGKKPLEEYIQAEMQDAIQILLDHGSKPYDLLHLTTFTASNAISNIIFGRRFKMDDPTFQMLMNFLKPVEGFDGFTAFSILQTMPVLLPLLGIRTIIMEAEKTFGTFLDGQIKEHEQTYTAGNIRDIVDVYLTKLYQLREKGEESGTIYTKEYMRANVAMLYVAGVDTTSTTIASMIKILAAHPQVQKKMQMEIDEVIGRERVPTLNDRLQLPYTEAALTELHRYITLFPLNFYRRATSDTTLFGYKIPKNTIVVANFWSVHRDPKTWTNPMQFNPERFLENPEKTAKLKERVIAFSMGKRACIGESLARMEIFHFITAFLQRFTFEPPTGEKFNFDPVKFNPGAKHDNYRVCAIPRN